MKSMNDCCWTDISHRAPNILSTTLVQDSWLARLVLLSPGSLCFPSHAARLVTKGHAKPAVRKDFGEETYGGLTGYDPGSLQQRSTFSIGVMRCRKPHECDSSFKPVLESDFKVVSEGLNLIAAISIRLAP